jgi:hypothetical protein
MGVYLQTADLCTNILCMRDYRLSLVKVAIVSTHVSDQEVSEGKSGKSSIK